MQHTFEIPSNCQDNEMHAPLQKESEKAATIDDSSRNITIGRRKAVFLR